MALFLLYFIYFIVFGFIARTNAWPYPVDIPGDDEEGYDFGAPLSQLCHQAFSDNEPEYDQGFVSFMVEVICPSLHDDGSGEGSGGGGLGTLTIEIIVQALSSDPATQQDLTKIAEDTCQHQRLEHSGIRSFCHFRREGIPISSGGGGGGRSGSGSGSGDGDGDGGYGFYDSWSSDDEFSFSYDWENYS